MAAEQDGRWKRRTCTCRAYPWPHRPGGGLCRHPDPPLETFQGKAGKNAPVGMRRRSAIRKRLLKHYELHPIRDRALIRRWLVKLYVAYCYRRGYEYPLWWFGGYVPAMRVTAEGPYAPNAPTPQPFPPGYPPGSWREAIWRQRRIGPLRSVQRRRNRKVSVASADQRKNRKKSADRDKPERRQRGPSEQRRISGGTGP